jgi:hypothetical protein
VLEMGAGKAELSRAIQGHCRCGVVAVDMQNFRLKSRFVFSIALSDYFLFSWSYRLLHVCLEILHTHAPFTKRRTCIYRAERHLDGEVTRLLCNIKDLALVNTFRLSLLRTPSPPLITTLSIFLTFILALFSPHTKLSRSS